jgi:hypothetical protein
VGFAFPGLTPLGYYLSPFQGFTMLTDSSWWLSASSAFSASGPLPFALPQVPLCGLRVEIRAVLVFVAPPSTPPRLCASA